MSYSLVQGDLEPDMPIVIGASGALSALATALDVQLRWRKPDGTSDLVPLVVDSAGAGTVHRVWLAGDSDQIGLHQGQVVVTDATGEDATWPNDGTHLLWYVYPQV